MPHTISRPDRRQVLAGLGAAGLAPGTVLASGHAAPRPGVLADRVSQDRLRGHVESLSAFPTRWTNHPDFFAVEAWMRDAFLAGGADPAEILRLPYLIPSGKTRHNILCGDPRSDRGVLLVGAHIDSISERPVQLAPGANDNASGIAAMLEVHRILAPLELGREIVCVAFSGEEQGLLGSSACADLARREGWPVELMLNLDMLGYRPPRPDAPIVIEFDQGNAVSGNDAAARGHAMRAARMAAAHTTLRVAHTDIWASDYMPFEAQGFPCIGFYDGSVDSPDYHSVTDTADRVDFARLEQVARLAVATLADAAGAPS